MLIRRATPADVPAIHAAGAAVIRDGRGVVRAPDEIDSLELFTERCKDFFSPDAEPYLGWFVAEVGGAIAGECNVRRYRPSYVRHVAVLGIEVAPAFQRRGIGRELIREAIAWARTHEVLRLELSVRADNARARALYESEGFQLEYSRSRFVRLSDGTFVDDCGYARWLAIG
jgi:RimJ/RimL family protein N-acetyltransferase